MDIGQRQPLQKRGCTTSTERTQGQASFHYGELAVVKRHYRVPCKQVIRAFRAVLSELKMYAEEWPEVITLVESVLNNSLLTRLNKRTPMQVFTGHEETTPLALMLKDIVPVNAPLDFIKAQKLMEVDKLSKARTKILDARYNEKEMFHELLVAWRGFPLREATWKPYSVMAVDIPDKMAKFMETHEDTDAVREMRSL
jgi:hypothetical protein